MKLEKSVLIAEIIGGLAIVVTLIVLIVEVRVNTDAIQSATAQAVHENFATWYSSIQGDPELFRVSLQGMRDYSSLSEIEKGQFIAMFMSFVSYSQNAFYKWQEGSLSPELWQGWELISMNIFSTPGGKDFWEERGYVFGDTYRAYVDTQILPKDPDPRARPWGADEILP